MRASKEIYMAAKSGVPDPVNNLALKAAIEEIREKVHSEEIDALFALLNALPPEI